MEASAKGSARSSVSATLVSMVDGLARLSRHLLHWGVRARVHRFVTCDPKACKSAQGQKGSAFRSPKLRRQFENSLTVLPGDLTENGWRGDLLQQS
jgi:hypothetical protein